MDEKVGTGMFGGACFVMAHMSARSDSSKLARLSRSLFTTIFSRCCRLLFSDPHYSLIYFLSARFELVPGVMAF